MFVTNLITTVVDCKNDTKAEMEQTGCVNTTLLVQ